MQPQHTHQAIIQTLQTIVDRGGNCLYQSYIKQKLPNHASQQTADLISTEFKTPYATIDSPLKIKSEQQPKGSQRESLKPGCIPKQKIDKRLADTADQTFNTNVQDIRKNEISCDKIKITGMANSIGIKTERNSPRKFTARLREKLNLNFHRVNNPEIESQETKLIRLEKQSSIHKNQCIIAENTRKQRQKQFKHSQLQEKLQELEVLGIPYAYDNQGVLCYPEVKVYLAHAKAKESKDQARQRKKIIGLGHRTIDVGDIQRYVSDTKKVVGRKRGYFSSQFYKKLKMTNEEFNNHNNRQNSAVPYVNLCQGIRITQRQRNIIVQRTKRTIPTLNQYKQKTSKNFFKSFIPQYEHLSNSCLINQNTNNMETTFNEQSQHRPHTTAHFNRTKRTIDTTITHDGRRCNSNDRKIRNSILWRPQTQSKGCRMSVCNKELVEKIIDG